MSQVDDIRRLWLEGRDVSEISRMTGHDRKTVRKYLQMEDFSPEAPTPKQKGPSKLDPFKGILVFGDLLGATTGPRCRRIRRWRVDVHWVLPLMVTTKCVPRSLKLSSLVRRGGVPGKGHCPISLDTLYCSQDECEWR